MGDETFGIDPDVAQTMAEEIHSAHSLGVEIATVIGGGNIFRGIAPTARGMDRVSADHMGMLATVINAVALQDALEKLGVHTRVMSAIEMREVAEPFIRPPRHPPSRKGAHRDSCRRNREPLLSTDTAAALRAMEVKAEVILKGTRVAGIYSADPEKTTRRRCSRRSPTWKYWEKV